MTRTPLSQRVLCGEMFAEHLTTHLTRDLTRGNRSLLPQGEDPHVVPVGGDAIPEHARRPVAFPSVATAHKWQELGRCHAGKRDLLH